MVKAYLFVVSHLYMYTNVRVEICMLYIELELNALQIMVGFQEERENRLGRPKVGN